MLKVSIQNEDFCLSEEIFRLENDNNHDGATVTFVGRVRNKNDGKEITSLFLEHYPLMTEKCLYDIANEAKQRFQVGNIAIIHRVGHLTLGEQIVFVGVTSPHRGQAFQATEYIMDYLKIRAPFWKKESTKTGEHWVEAKSSDEQKATSWKS